MSAYNLQKRLIEAISSRGNTIIWIGGLQNEESRNKYNAGGPISRGCHAHLRLLLMPGYVGTKGITYEPRCESKRMKVGGFIPWEFRMISTLDKCPSIPRCEVGWGW